MYYNRDLQKSTTEVVFVKNSNMAELVVVDVVSKHLFDWILYNFWVVFIVLSSWVGLLPSVGKALLVGGPSQVI